MFFSLAYFAADSYHRTQQRLIRRQPVRDEAPLLAVPLLDPHPGATLMVGAGQLHWRDKTFESQLLDALVVEIQVFQSPAHLLASERLVAELTLRGANCLDDDRGVDHAAVVEDL